MKLKKIAALGLALSVLSAFKAADISAADANVHYKNVTFSDVEVNGGEVIKGVDISSVIALENSGVVFRDRNGQPQDIFLTLKEAGVNYIRVRIWNDPYNAGGETYGGGVNDVETAVKIAERCHKYGLSLLVDFHYSDFWADPGKQYAPKAWTGFTADQKAQALKSFTHNALNRISVTGVNIGMVQVGNETTTGMSGETNWENICKLMNAASETIRNFDKNILIAVHFTNPEKSGWHDTLAGYLKRYNVDYDVFATSYYPYWHGTIENLTSVLRNISQKYGKYVMVAETSWANSFDDTDSFGNTISSADQLGNYVSYDVSVQGQINSVSDVFKAVSDVGSKGIGVFYWEPAWLTVGNEYYSNLDKWEKYGSGWATKAAGEYQDDAAQYFGGSSVDNQALFSADGVPLDSLYLFGHIRSVNLKGKENLIQNAGFENDRSVTDTPQGWKLLNTTSGEYSKFTVNSEMVKSGNYSVHWYSPNKFEKSGIQTEYTASKSGKYSIFANIAGEKSRCELTVFVNDKQSAFTDGTTTAYDQWDELSAEFYAKEGDRIKIEINVSGDNESYGSIDDCGAYLIKEEYQPPEQQIKGDIDKDGSVSVSDLMKLRMHMLGMSELEREGYEFADMNDDSRIDIIDLILLINKLINII